MYVSTEAAIKKKASYTSKGEGSLGRGRSSAVMVEGRGAREGGKGAINTQFIALEDVEKKEKEGGRCWKKGWEMNKKDGTALRDGKKVWGQGAFSRRPSLA